VSWGLNWSSAKIFFIIQNHGMLEEEMPNIANGLKL
jgi:hypothetical protein